MARRVVAIQAMEATKNVDVKVVLVVVYVSNVSSTSFVEDIPCGGYLLVA